MRDRMRARQFIECEEPSGGRVVTGAHSRKAEKAGAGVAGVERGVRTQRMHRTRVRGRLKQCAMGGLCLVLDCNERRGRFCRRTQAFSHKLSTCYQHGSAGDEIT